MSGGDFRRRGVGPVPELQSWVRGPVAPSVGAVLAYLCLVPWWHRVLRVWSLG